MRKLLKISAWGLGILFVLALLGIWFVAPYAIISRPPKSPDGLPANKYEGLKNLDFDTFSVKTQDNFNLKGVRTYTRQDTCRGTVILLHGIGSNKESYFGLMQNLAQQGFNSIAYDGRGHGESSGEYITFGYYEKNDVSEIVDWSLTTEHKKDYTVDSSARVGIWGQSLGGAIALQALAVEPRLKFGVIECTFTSMRQIVKDYQKRICKGWNLGLLAEIALWRAEKIARFSADDVRPIESVKHIAQPVIMVHGEKDHNIKFEYGQELYNALASKNKQFVSVPNAGHNNLNTVGGNDLMQKIFNFLKVGN